MPDVQVTEWSEVCVMRKPTHKDGVAVRTDDGFDSRRRSKVGFSPFPVSNASGFADNCEPMCWRHRSCTANNRLRVTQFDNVMPDVSHGSVLQQSNTSLNYSMDDVRSTVSKYSKAEAENHWIQNAAFYKRLMP